LYDRQRLIELVKEHALRFGDFTLASGKKASYYLDCRKLTLDSEGANVIAAGILELIADDFPDAVGGMAIGADPITAAVITCAWQQNNPLKGFIVRKEAKAHGTGQQVEGPVESGQTAIMMEDVVTTGGSSLRAIEHAREFGLKVDRIIAIVDRGENSAAIFDNVGVKFHSLLHVKDLGV
jgi:orotate phosphoribosyltransferase